MIFAEYPRAISYGEKNFEVSKVWTFITYFLLGYACSFLPLPHPLYFISYSKKKYRSFEISKFLVTFESLSIENVYVSPPPHCMPCFLYFTQPLISSSPSHHNRMTHLFCHRHIQWNQPSLRRTWLLLPRLLLWQQQNLLSSGNNDNNDNNNDRAGDFTQLEHGDIQELKWEMSMNSLGPSTLNGHTRWSMKHLKNWHESWRMESINHSIKRVIL